MLDHSDERAQGTIAQELTISGRGLLSGTDTRVTLHPRPIDSGIAFLRNDAVIPVSYDQLSFVQSHTTALSIDGRSVMNIEHLMSALAGLGIDNMLVEIEGDDPPHLIGGNSSNWASLVTSTGVLRQPKSAACLQVSDSDSFSIGSSLVEMGPALNGRLAVSIIIDFPLPIGRQSLEYVHLGAHSYVEEIAWARTFCWQSNEHVWPDGTSHWEWTRARLRMLPSDPNRSPILCYTEEQWVVPPLQHDEPARHKILDFIGDMTLIGCRLAGKFRIHYPGHAVNHEIVRRLLSYR